jgi:hypothetical protein
MSGEKVEVATRLVIFEPTYQSRCQPASGTCLPTAPQARTPCGSRSAGGGDRGGPEPDRTCAWALAPPEQLGGAGQNPSEEVRGLPTPSSGDAQFVPEGGSPRFERARSGSNSRSFRIAAAPGRAI